MSLGKSALFLYALHSALRYDLLDERVVKSWTEWLNYFSSLILQVGELRPRGKVIASSHISHEGHKCLSWLSSLCAPNEPCILQTMPLWGWPHIIKPNQRGRGRQSGVFPPAMICNSRMEPWPLWLFKLNFTACPEHLLRGEITWVSLSWLGTQLTGYLTRPLGPNDFLHCYFEENSRVPGSPECGEDTQIGRSSEDFFIDMLMF